MTKNLSHRLVSALAVLLLTGVTARADVLKPCDAVSCNPCDEIACDPCDPISLFSERNACRRKKSLLDSIEVYGWIQGGVYANSRGATTTRYRAENYKGREVSFLDNGNGFPLSSLQSTDLQVNQVWLGAKKEADGRHGLDWGFGVEGFFGTEAEVCQSYSDAKFDYGWQDGDYYTAIPQAYVQLALGDWSVKFGKFETTLGYEAIQAPDFFFYSRSSLNVLEPSSHTGALLEYAPTDRLSLGVAYITGADASFENKYDDHGVLGTLSYQLTDRVELAYSMMFNRYGGGDYPSGEPRESGRADVYFQSLTATVALTKKLEYVFQWDYGDTRHRGEADHDYVYGIANYLVYRFNDRWGLGFRTDWIRGLYVGDVSEYTLCLNWQPYKNLSIRPEIRYDYGSDKTVKYFNHGRNRDQFSGGVCGVVSF